MNSPINKKGNSWWIWALAIGMVLLILGFANNSEDVQGDSSPKSITGNVVERVIESVVDNEESEKTIRELDEARESQESIKVSYIKDGDSIVLDNGEEIRLIGINAPEKGEKCYEEAKEFLEYFVLGKEITLERDVEDKDQYGRLLRYVFIDENNVNYRMIYNGFAHKYKYGSNVKYSFEFEEAENKAKEYEGCLWEKAEENYIEEECFTIMNFHFNAEGDDNYNLNDEYVVLRNKCDYQVDMTDWTIKDNTASHIYYFSQFIISDESLFTLYTGMGIDTNTELYWGRQEESYAAIWNNNGGDTLFLRDDMGNLVLTKSYEGYS